MSSNLAVLTKSHNIIASKKRARKEQIKEIVFNEDDRRDFLTGFHKRKLQKKEDAKKKAQDRDKQERLDVRREKRQLLAERAVENAEQVERAYRKVIAGEESDEDEEDTVFTSTKGTPIVADEAYEDEEQLAIVTVIEDFDPDTLIHGPSKSRPDESAQSPPAAPVSHEKPRKLGQGRNAKTVGLKKSRAKTSTRSKDIKYETKADRNTERTKQRARKTEKATLAGGKGSRKKAHGRGKR
ncbi:hypothetical protein EUX98_g1877 [Antrodiella citrinella]|uniref:Ribosomal RNA-processing protein 17 n=1 Tax=Antrodiella citrinella TaxID=2447956 RepID=A0A4S4N0C8_9APHY|nr:hypothetical protein EUX98_g1877 [Antrodiella citrinella]